MSDHKAELAFEILAREHSRMLTAYLRTLVHDEAAIDDLYQETMLVAWRRLDEIDLGKPFAPWLRGVAARLAMAHHRKKRSLPFYLNEVVNSLIDRQFDAIDGRVGDTWGEKTAALHDCISGLTSAHQAAIRGRYFSQLRYADLSERLGTSLEACKKRLVRGRKLLAECMRRKGILLVVEADNE